MADKDSYETPIGRLKIKDEGEILEQIPRASLKRFAELLDGKATLEFFGIIEVAAMCKVPTVSDSTFRDQVLVKQVRYETLIELRGWMETIIAEKEEQAKKDRSIL